MVKSIKMNFGFFVLMLVFSAAYAGASEMNDIVMDGDAIIEAEMNDIADPMEDLVTEGDAEEMGEEAAQFEIDGGHSTIGFAVKHLQVGTTRGSFTDYTGKVAYDPDDLSRFSADVTIQTNSLDTKVAARDNHLKSGDFFEVEKYPTITFKSNRLEKRGEGLVLVGDLTIKDVTKTLTIPVTVSGPVNSPSGAAVIGIAGQTQINRQDYGISWSKSMDNGGLVVDDMVDIHFEIEAQMK